MRKIWKYVKGYEGLYKVSNYGEVKRMSGKVPRGDGFIGVKGGVLIPKDNGKGYLRVKLTKNNKEKRIMLHRLIATAFVENPLNKPNVNHIDGNKKNNTINNLEWCTQSENMKHFYDNIFTGYSEKRMNDFSERAKNMKRRDGRWTSNS